MLPVFPNATTVIPTNRLDSLFDRMLDAGGVLQVQPAIPLSVWEDEDRIHVEAELPGLTYEDLDVTIHNRTLSIRGERRPDEGRKYLVNSRACGKFEQVLKLNVPVDGDKVQADLKDGILRIDLPKNAEARPRKIAVNGR